MFPKEEQLTAVLFIGISWFWSFALALPPLFWFGSFGVEDKGMGCSPSWRDSEALSYNLFLFGVGFFVPLTIIIVTNIDLFYLIHQVG